ncbi:MAG: hypothetical protein ACYDHP_05505 [Ferrimicrobium sp.]
MIKGEADTNFPAGEVVRSVERRVLAVLMLTMTGAFAGRGERYLTTRDRPPYIHPPVDVWPNALETVDVGIGIVQEVTLFVITRGSDAIVAGLAVGNVALGNAVGAVPQAASNTGSVRSVRADFFMIEFLSKGEWRNG